MITFIRSNNRVISFLIIFLFFFNTLNASVISINQKDCLSPSSEFSPIKNGIDLKDNLPSIPFTEYKNEKNNLTPFWAQVQIAASIFINTDKSISVDDIKSQVKAKFTEYKLDIDFSDKLFSDIINYLNERNLIVGNFKDGFKRKINDNYLMVWADDYTKIKETIENIVKNTEGNEIKREQDLQKLFTDFANACKTQKSSPNEANHPVLRAMAVLEKENRTILTKFMLDLKTKNQDLFKTSLINAIILSIDTDLKKAFDLLDDKIKNMWKALPEDTLTDAIMENFQSEVDVLTQEIHEKFFGKNWMILHASNVKGTIYEITPEGQDVAGGLGRVQQYHPVGMRDLGAKVAYVEPYYRYSKLYKGEAANYTSKGNVAVKVKGLGKPYKTFKVNVSGDVNPVEYNVYRGINERGIPVFLIRDVNEKYIKTMFAYDGDNPSQVDFSEFFTKAAWKFIEEEEYSKQKKQEDKWNKPIINCNDAQSLLLPVWRVVELLNLKKKIEVETDIVEKTKLEEHFNFLIKLVSLATTHTYKNRGFIGTYNDYWKDKFLKMGIPESLHWLFVAKGSHGEMNLSSAGLRASEIAKAVAGVHRDEVQEYDPNIDIVGISNGDDIKFSTRKLRELVEELYGSTKNQNELSIKEILAIKARAKNDVKINQISEIKAKIVSVMNEISKVEKEQNKSIETYLQHLKDYEGWNLILIEKIEKLISNRRYFPELLSAFNDFDPSLKTFGYIGRFVPEKAGMERAFTEKNMEELLKNGVNIVIYGNVQPYDVSIEIGKKMKEIMYRLNAKGYKGKLIFKDAFSITEHIDLMPALDMQINDSDRHTGACEITETNAMANLAIQFSPPFVEGLIAKQGAPINYTQKTGNTVLPIDDREESYRDAMLFIANMNPEEMTIFQKNSNKLSEVLDAKLTASEYLILMNEKIKRSEEWMLNFLENIERPIHEVELKDIYNEIIENGTHTVYLTDNIKPKMDDECLVRYFVDLKGIPLSHVNANLLLPNGEKIELTPVSQNGQIAVFVGQTKAAHGKTKFMLSSGITNVILSDWGIYGSSQREVLDRPIFSYEINKDEKYGSTKIAFKFFRCQYGSNINYKMHLGIPSIGNGWQFSDEMPKDIPLTFDTEDGIWKTNIDVPNTLSIKDLTFVLEDKQGNFLNNFGKDFYMSLAGSNPAASNQTFQSESFPINVDGILSSNIGIGDAA